MQKLRCKECGSNDIIGEPFCGDCGEEYK